MVSQDLLNILRCPACVRDGKGSLELIKDSWLCCPDCGRKFPVIEDIPVMLIEQGDKWQGTSKLDLPVPPPPIK